MDFATLYELKVTNTKHKMTETNLDKHVHTNWLCKFITSLLNLKLTHAYAGLSPITMRIAKCHLSLVSHPVVASYLFICHSYINSDR